MKRLVAIGECMVELSRQPWADDDLWRLGIAGDTLNTAWYARACLPDTWAVAYGTCIGHDAFSDRVPAFLTANGIEVDRIARHPSRKIGLYAISLNNGERSFAYWREISAARTMADDPAQLDAMLRDADVIYLSGITLAILPDDARDRLIARLAERRGQGVLTVLDPNIRPALWEDDETAQTWITRAARTCDVVLPSFDDEAASFGDESPVETLSRYRGLGVDIVVVKNGAGDIHAARGKDRFQINDLSTTMPIDTTGAGDSFNGGFLASLLTGANLEAAIRSGHAVAAQVVGHRGALVEIAR